MQTLTFSFLLPKYQDQIAVAIERLSDFNFHSAL